MKERDEAERLAAIVMVTALSISLSACLVEVVRVIWPYITAAVEAWRFAP